MRRWHALLLCSPLLVAAWILVMDLVIAESRSGSLAENTRIAVWGLISLLAMLVSAVQTFYATRSHRATRRRAETPGSPEIAVSSARLTMTATLLTAHLLFFLVAVVRSISPEGTAVLADEAVLVGLICGQYALLVGGVVAGSLLGQARRRLAREEELNSPEKECREGDGSEHDER